MRFRVWTSSVLVILMALLLATDIGIRLPAFGLRALAVFVAGSRIAAVMFSKQTSRRLAQDGRDLDGARPRLRRAGTKGYRSRIGRWQEGRPRADDSGNGEDTGHNAGEHAPNDVRFQVPRPPERLQGRLRSYSSGTKSFRMAFLLTQSSIDRAYGSIAL